jgi:hypothetical protein
LSLTTTPIPSAPALAGTATSVVRDDVIYTVVAGEGTGTGGLATLGPDGLVEHAGVPSATRVGHGAASTRDATVLILGGTIAGAPTATAIVADAGLHRASRLLATLPAPPSAATATSPWSWRPRRRGTLADARSSTSRR